MKALPVYIEKISEEESYNLGTLKKMVEESQSDEVL